MIPKSVQSLFSLSEDETIKLKRGNVMYYLGGSLFDERDASLIVTNFRIVLFIKKRGGYKNKIYEIYIDEILSVDMAKNETLTVKITTNEITYQGRRKMNAIKFGSIDHVNSFYNLIKNLIDQKNKKPKLVIISETTDNIIKNDVQVLNIKIVEVKKLLDSLEKRFMLGDINENNYEELKQKYGSLLKNYLLQIDELNDKLNM